MSPRSWEPASLASLPVSVLERTASVPHTTLVFGGPRVPAPGEVELAEGPVMNSDRGRGRASTVSDGQFAAGTDTVDRQPAPRQPLFPCRYETWRSKRNGREVVVIDYDEDLGRVEYMYFDDQEWVHATRSDTWTKRFVFVRSP